VEGEALAPRAVAMRAEPMEAGGSGGPPRVSGGGEVEAEPSRGTWNGEGTADDQLSDDLGGMSFADAISGNIVEFDEGDMSPGP